MSLASRIADLAGRIGLEVKTKIDATHPGLARAWVNFGYVDGQIVVRSSYNVASVTRLAYGRYRLTFATAMPDADYCWTGIARSSTNGGTMQLLLVRATTDEKTPTHVDFCCAAVSATYVDTTEINIVVYR
mgnify:CR=1 FL=1